MIVFAFLLVPLLILISVVYSSLRNGISPTPSSRKQREAILKKIPAGTTGNIYDLGSGWGTLAIALGKHLPQCRIIGFESSPVPYAVSLVLAYLARAKNVTFRKANFLQLQFEDAKIIVCYLYPGGMRKLQSKFEEGLRPGTLIISNTFAIPGWEPTEIVTTADLFRSPIYVYRLVESVQGVKGVT